MAVHHHLIVEPRAEIAVSRPRNGGNGYVVNLDTPGAMLTVFMSREQLAALVAASTVALSKPVDTPIGSESNGNHRTE